MYKYFIGIMFCVLCLLGCGRNTDSTVKIGLSTRPGSSLIQFAQQEGIFRKEGLRVQLFRRGGTAETKDDFIKGKVDAAVLSIVEIIELIDKGYEFVIPLVLDYSNGSDGIVVKEKCRNLKGLKGHVAGIQYGTVSQYLFLRALDSRDVKVKDIAVRNIYADEAVELFVGGSVDAFAAWEPYVTYAVNEGAGRIVFTTRDLPEKIVDALIVRKEYAQKNPRNIRRIIDAWYETVEYLRDNYSKTVVAISDAEHVSPETVKNVLSSLRIGDQKVNSEVFGDGKSFGQMFIFVKEIAGHMKRYGMIKNVPDIKKYIYPDLFYDR